MELKYTPTLGEQEALRIINAEKNAWEDGQVFVTDRVQFIMRNVVKKARKNYWGIFNEPKDPVTGRDKIFIPFTEWVVETMLKNIDIDTKDIEVKATHPSTYGVAAIFRYILKKKLDDVFFGITLNDVLRRTAIDGTGFLKAEKENGKLKVSIPDRLNMIYDQGADCLDDTPIIERAVINKPDFDKFNWKNSEYVKGATALDQVNSVIGGTSRKSEIPFVEVYQRHGYLPKFCLTGKDEDMNTFVYCKVVVSGLNSSPVVHSIEEVEEHPYGCLKLKSVPNRMDGKGIAEMLFNIQAYLNEVVNLRLNKGRIVHLGLFELKGNVTPQQFKRMFATGAIKTDVSSSITPIQTGAIDPSSYNDEQQAYTWGNRVTGTTQEDEVTDNRPATNSIIAQQGAGKGYNLRMEDLFLCLSMFIKEKVIPIILEELTEGEIVRITGDPKALKEIDEMLSRNFIYKKIEQMDATDRMQLTDDVVEEMVNLSVAELQKLGKDRFPEIAKKIFDIDYDLQITMGDEQMNKSIAAGLTREMIGMLAPLGKDVDPLIREWADMMGMDGDAIIEDMNKNPQPQGQPQEGQGGQMPEQMPMPANQMPMPQ